MFKTPGREVLGSVGLVPVVVVSVDRFGSIDILLHSTGLPGRAPHADPGAGGAARSPAPQAPAPGNRGPRLSPIPSHGEGSQARWASWDRGH
eukprot:1156911-Alexandrium_andersonii.AAC.1